MNNNNHYPNIKPWHDKTVLPFGRTHKGKQLDQIPDDYFCYFWRLYSEQYLAGKMNWPNGISLMMYIEDNLDSLEC